MTASMTLKKFHITGFLRYLLLLLTDILALWYFHGYLFLLLLLILILTLPASAIATFLGLQKLTVSMRPVYAKLPYRTENRIQIQCRNTTVFPLFHLTFDLSETNLFLADTRSFTHRHYRPAPSGRRRRRRIRRSLDVSRFKKRYVSSFPKEIITLRHTIRKDFCGNIRVDLQHLQLTDYLGIFTFERQESFSASAMYLPRKDDCIEYDASMHQSMEDLQKEVLKKGFDDPEPLQIREYIPGDKLNHIHWKISSKYEQLMVKEFEKEEGGRIFLAVDLYYWAQDTVHEINSVLDRTYQAANHFLQMHYHVTIGWWSACSNTFLHREILNEDLLEDTFLEIVQEQTYTQKTLLEDYLGDDSPYIIKW